MYIPLFNRRELTGLRGKETREERLRRIPSAYNYRLVTPNEKNITTEADARELFNKEYETFLREQTNALNAKGDFRDRENIMPTRCREAHFSFLKDMLLLDNYLKGTM